MKYLAGQFEIAGPLFALIIAPAVAIVPAGRAAAQSPSAALTPTILLASGHAPVNERPDPPPSELRREIDDPHTGLRWLLFRDPAHPGGPGRLVPVASSATTPSAASESASPPIQPPRPIIRAGDRVIVEQETPIVDARLEGTALGPAQPGSALRVRLRIGGQIVSALAVAPGRATLQPIAEAP